MNTNEDTIAAIASSLGEGGIGVVRISGPNAFSVADHIFVSKNGKRVFDQKGYTAQYGAIVNSLDEKRQSIDDVLLFVMRSPKSYTREDMVEISCHGGRVVMKKILDLCLQHGARLAEPGEFTKRAFLNGRIDLIQAETVMDIIRAKSDKSYAFARQQMEGNLSTRIREIRDTLKEILSQIEAALDFPDDLLDPMSRKQLEAKLNEEQMQMQKLIHRSSQGRMIQDGIRVVLTGRTNVGKSSLLNLLSDSNRVIVSPEPGTTRDVVETEVEWDGYCLKLADTAGWHSSANDIDNESMKRSQAAIHEADLVIYVFDVSQPVSEDDKAHLNLLNSHPCIYVLNKMDQAHSDYLQEYLAEIGNASHVKTSCVKENGIEELKEMISERLKDGWEEKTDEIWVYSVRHLDLFRKAVRHLELAKNAFQQDLSLEFAASDIRMAMDALGEIVGEVVTDDILDLVFRDFCIGK